MGKNVGEGRRAQGLPQIPGLSPGGAGVLLTDVPTKSGFVGGKERFHSGHVASHPVTYQRDSFTCKFGVPDTGCGWRDGFKSPGIGVFETVELNQWEM